MNRIIYLTILLVSTMSFNSEAQLSVKEMGLNFSNETVIPAYNSYHDNQNYQVYYMSDFSGADRSLNLLGGSFGIPLQNAKVGGTILKEQYGLRSNISLSGYYNYKLTFDQRKNNYLVLSINPSFQYLSLGDFITKDEEDLFLDNESINNIVTFNTGVSAYMNISLEGYGISRNKVKESIGVGLSLQNLIPLKTDFTESETVEYSNPIHSYLDFIYTKPLNNDFAISIRSMSVANLKYDFSTSILSKVIFIDNGLTLGAGYSTSKKLLFNLGVDFGQEDDSSIFLDFIGFYNLNKTLNELSIFGFGVSLGYVM